MNYRNMYGRMNYLAVGNRCAASLNSLQLPISNEKARSILARKGFKVVDVNLVALARQCIGISEYRRGAQEFQAPDTVDCSSFVQWLYGKRGIWLPRRSIQQREFGSEVSLSELIAGDLVFAVGTFNYYRDDPADGVGHVGIATDRGTIIHAANSKLNVTEVALPVFLKKAAFRGARRYIPWNSNVLTFETPPHRAVKLTDDLRWIVLQSLPNVEA